MDMMVFVCEHTVLWYLFSFFLETEALQCGSKISTYVQVTIKAFRSNGSENKLKFCRIEKASEVKCFVLL